jgi:hypothetical protein
VNSIILWALTAAPPDPYATLRELPKQLPLDAYVRSVTPAMAESQDGTDRVELTAGKRLVVYLSHPKDLGPLCPVKAGQRVRIIAADTDLPEIATRLEFRIVDSGRLCKGRLMLTLNVTGANPSERLKAGVTADPGAPVREREIEAQRIAVLNGADERPVTVTPYRFDTSNKFYVASTFAACVFKMGDALDVAPFQWSMCASGSRCWVNDAKTGTPCTLWTDAVQTDDTLPSAEEPKASSSR